MVLDGYTGGDSCSIVRSRGSQAVGGLSSSSSTARASLSAQQGIHPGLKRGESPVLLPQLLGLVLELFHPLLVLHLALLVAGIPSPVEQLLLFEKASPTQPSPTTTTSATEAAMNQTPHSCGSWRLPAGREMWS